MSRRQELTSPPSLAQYFAPDDEDDYRGCFGWMCGYSADSTFLNDAAERFMGQTKNQRAHSGRIGLVLMLDPGNPQITPVEVPGVLHIPILEPSYQSPNGSNFPGLADTPAKNYKLPFQLLHAKVALLGFRHVDSKRWRLRLIVSTGNWTRQTLEDSIDLVWSLDVSSEDLTSKTEETSKAFGDLNAAWDMLDWLRKHFDTRIINAVHPNLHDTDSRNCSQLFENWMSEIKAKGGRTKSRFFDNRSDSLLGKLPKMISKIADSKRRNYLAMGSGFFETDSTKNGTPRVLSKIVSTLQKEGLFTQKAPVGKNQKWIEVYVNPNACQTLATSKLEEGWTLREAGQPSYFGSQARSLHAKFIFSANWRDNSDKCNSPWLYLGSGNLTGPGFTQKMTSSGGNLEAGVVFAPEKPLSWPLSKRVPPEQLLSNVLPVQWNSTCNPEKDSLTAGNPMEDRKAVFFQAPVAWLIWGEEKECGWLYSPVDVDYNSFDISDDGSGRCQKDSARGFQWKWTQPRQVTLHWKNNDGHERHAIVPVLDEFGRIAATALPAITLEDVWWQLANFPMPPDDEELPGEEAIADAKNGNHEHTTGKTNTSTYPVRQMMELIENIASKQTAIPQADWSSWCLRLEQCLTQAAGSSRLRDFLTNYQLNPLSPLRHPSFRPEFAENSKSMEGQRYVDALTRVEKIWGVADLSKIGELP